MNLQEQACLSYIRENKILCKILERFINKYASYGEVAGKVTISKLGLDDIESLEGFFQKNYHGRKQITISAKDIEKALWNSRFSMISKTRLLELYAKTELKSKAEEKSEEKARWDQMFQEVEQSMERTKAYSWLKQLQSDKGFGYAYLQGVHKSWEGSLEKTKEIVLLGCSMINEFPINMNKKESLAIYATKLTGNPHAFDERESLGSFLDQLLKWEWTQAGNCQKKDSVFTSLEKQKRYLHAGILRDEISNYAVISGVQARTKEGNIHKGIQGFFQEKESMQLSLLTVSNIEEVICQNEELFIVENPSIYAKLLNEWKGRASIMCMNGQPKLASLLILDRLNEKKVRIYYGGDFDPEGLLIAWKLKQYYGGCFHYWHMGVEAYQKSCSNELISDKRMESLNGVTDEQLSEVVALMRTCKRAGYQEKIVANYLNKIGNV